jgi:hypothetical protein
MSVHTFLHRHYSSQVGESPAGHAIAIITGAALVAVGIVLALSVAFLPIGTVVGLLGVFLLVEGVLAHIERPLKLSDLLDAMIGLAGAAIALTFALAVAVFLVSFGAGTIAGVIEWLRQAL